MTEPGQPCVMISGNAFSCARPHMDEVDVEPVDLGRELRQRVQPRLAACASRSPSPSTARAPAAIASCTPCDRSSTSSAGGPARRPRSGGAGRRSARPGSRPRRARMPVAVVGGGAHAWTSPQRSDAEAARISRQKSRLFPGGEVAAPVDLVEVDDVRVARLDPAARRPPDLARERREGERDLDVRQGLPAGGRGVCAVGLPVRTGGRGAGARQPVQRDVVEDVVAA